MDKPSASRVSFELRPLVISAPFGNYIQPGGATATLGTFTAAARPGRVWRILKTVRYYRRLDAWVNKIGLRNPGIDWLAGRAGTGKIDLADKIVSVHGFAAADWWQLFDTLAGLKPLAAELNMSCPNVGEIDWPADLFARALDKFEGRVVVKLPPVRYEQMLGQAVAAGVRVFHCCNTLPVAAGGMSGKPLKPLSIHCIRAIRSRDDGDEFVLIGGGGVGDTRDVDDFFDAGASVVAVGTKVMHPKYLWTQKPLEPLISRAIARVSG